MTAPDAALAALLRRNLPELGEGAAIMPDTPLAELGLDSMRAVDILFDIEDSFGVRLPDEALTPETFATPAGLTAAIRQAREGARG